MGKLNQLLTTFCLLLLLATGSRVLQLLSQAETSLTEIRTAITAASAQLQLSLQSTQAVLISVRATTEAVRRSSASQLGYYEAIGRRSSRLLAESTLLVQRTNERLELLTGATNGLINDGRGELAQAGSALKATLDTANETLASVSGTAKQVQRTLGDAGLPALAADLALSSRQLARTSAAAETALESVNEVLAPSSKGFWRRLLEAFVPRSKRPQPEPAAPR